MPDLVQRIPFIIIMLLSLSVHEWAHAAMAVRLGDDTPIRQGRYTLNPIAHIDWFGTILLPLLGVPFGWAKPVEWNPRNIRREVPMRRALWMVAAAGPLSNIVLAVLSSVLLVVLARMPSLPDTDLMLTIASHFIVMNIGLALFNMIPVPPLDGSRIVDAHIPRSMVAAWSKVHEYAPYILIVLIIVLRWTGVLQGAVSAVYSGIINLAVSITGG